MERRDARYLESIDEHVLSYKNNRGVPWWLCIRDCVLNEVEHQLSKEEPPMISARNLNLNSFKYYTTSFLSSKKMHHKLKSAEVVFDVSTRFSKDPISGLMMNRYADYFAEAAGGESCILEHASAQWEVVGRRLHSNSFPLGLIDTLSLLKANILVKTTEIPESLQKLTDYYLQQLFKCYRDELHYGKIRDEFKKSYIRFLFRTYTGRKIIKKLTNETKIVFVIGGSYAENSDYILGLKEKNIVVAELQHGAFNRSGNITNPPALVVQCPYYKLTKPDFFLMYGSWWKSQYSIPWEGIPIGNPLREETLDSLRSSILDKPRKKVITIIGCSLNTYFYLDLANSLAYHLEDYCVVFRPHPIEIEEAKKLSCFFDKVSLDTAPLYESLINSSVVAGAYSTVLFEAMGIVDKVAIYALNEDADTLNELPFLPFFSLEELVQIVTSDVTIKDDLNNEVWRLGWKNNFQLFLERNKIRTN